MVDNQNKNDQLALFEPDTPARPELPDEPTGGESLPSGPGHIRSLGQEAVDNCINPGTERYFEDIGGGLPEDSAAREPSKPIGRIRTRRPIGHVRDFASDRDFYGLDDKPRTPEQQQAFEKFKATQSDDLHRTLAENALQAIEGLDDIPAQKAAISRARAERRRRQK